MHRTENKNAPLLDGWVIAAAAGLVAFGVLVLVGEFDLFPAAALAGVISAVVGMILGMPWGAEASGPVVPGIRAAAAPTPAPHNPAPPPVAEAVTTAPPAVVSAAAPLAAPTTKVAQKAALSAGPLRLTAPRGGKADDLKEIEGVGPAMEKLANGLGFYHFDQIAGWTDADVALVDAEMKGFKGRIARDRWVAQAKIIVSEGLEVFRTRAKTNDY